MKYLLSLLSLTACFSANAEFYDGNDLLSRLNSESYYSKGAGTGYITGVSDVTHGVLHCAPPNVTIGQTRDMVALYLTNNPDQRHNSADRLVLRVLQAAWPCQQRNNSRGGQTL